MSSDEITEIKEKIEKLEKNHKKILEALEKINQNIIKHDKNSFDIMRKVWFKVSHLGPGGPL